MERSAPRPPAETSPAFYRYGPDAPVSPVVVSIPHAGRAYPAELLRAARVRPELLGRMEDRGADLIAHPLIAADHAVLVARMPRAMIDLNRNEREVDPAMVSGLPHQQPLQTSGKMRAGLGLIPRRLPGVGDLWLHALPWAAVCERVERYHRPYHAALAAMMARARAAFGHAILIDLHSMPPLAPPPGGGEAAGIVLGDRFGRSAAARLMQVAADVAEGRGMVTARNNPYAGDHLLERHGRPERGMHALQVEIDRRLYLDPAMERPGPGLAAMQRLMRDLVAALERELPLADYAMAAE
ncbi:N-formylglutamate amidohydrolase [Sphingobium sp. AN641]|uniref:N-formylglutamate amidohydrolase n=1 Tax=Sphingobium sp. AN641 TaxID=3133443 RepID=UPI0030C415C5